MPSDEQTAVTQAQQVHVERGQHLGPPPPSARDGPGDRGQHYSTGHIEQMVLTREQRAQRGGHGPGIKKHCAASPGTRRKCRSQRERKGDVQRRQIVALQVQYIGHVKQRAGDTGLAAVDGRRIHGQQHETHRPDDGLQHQRREQRQDAGQAAQHERRQQEHRCES